MEKIVAAKTLTSRVASRMALSIAEKEKLEAYEKQDKLNAKEAKLKAEEEARAAGASPSKNV